MSNNNETIIYNPNIKLLVVDDREDNLFSIETILEKDNYTIVKANSGRSALKILLKEQDFTLILMDVQMPDLNGFETAALIYDRDKLKHIPIIFITANDHKDDSIFKGYQLGGVEYIYKPINPELLRAKVAVFVELYKKNNELLIQEQKLMAANKRLEKEIEEKRISENKVNVLNKQLIENIAQLKATNQELERYAFVASHDLQEPIRKIILFGKILQDKYGSALDDNGQDFLDRIVKASTRMQALIKNLLNFSRSAADEGVCSEVDLGGLVNDILNEIEMPEAQKQAVFKIGTLPKIYGIPEQIRQLFQNLISNALKFSGENKLPEITINAEKTKGMYIPGISYDKYDESYFRITVQDNGIGFEDQYADQIFVIFKRLHTFEKFEGTGIGLSICKKIVEKHNGYIYANGKPNEGATFTIVLPVKQPEMSRQLER